MGSNEYSNDVNILDDMTHFWDKILSDYQHAMDNKRHTNDEL